MFTGTIDRHPDRGAIIGFLHDHGVEALYLRDEPAVDIGGIIRYLSNRNAARSKMTAFLLLVFYIGLRFAPDWICHCSLVQGRIVKVGVYLRRVQIAVAKHLLKRTRIDAVFQHKSRRGVPELVRRIAAAVKPRLSGF